MLDTKALALTISGNLAIVLMCFKIGINFIKTLPKIGIDLIKDSLCERVMRTVVVSSDTEKIEACT